MADILVAGGWVITMDPDRRVIENGAVAIGGNRILEVGPKGQIEARHQVDRVIDASGKVVMPGLIDGHGHAGHSLLKTLGVGRPGVWAETADRIYAEATDEEYWYADALLTSLERLKFGVTAGVTFLGGGTMVVRTDSPVYGERHCEAVERMGTREFLAVGPSNAPYPRRYVEWDGESARRGWWGSRITLPPANR